MSNPLNTLSFAKKQCCNQDCNQGRACPQRAQRQASALGGTVKRTADAEIYKAAIIFGLLFNFFIGTAVYFSL